MKRRISFRVHKAGWIVLAVAFGFAPSHEVLAAVTALIWHEVTHLLVMLLCGVKQCRIELTPFGGMADVADYDRLTPLGRALSAAAGIAGSAAGAWISYSFQAPFWHASFRMHASLLLINMLPVWPLDGSRILLAAASCLGVELGARRLMAVLANLLGAGLVALGIYGVWHGYLNVSLFVIGPYLCYASENGRLSEQLRSIQNAHAKLHNADEVIPLHASVCRTDDISAVLPQLMGRLSSSRYHMLIQLGEDFCVRRIWTEHEMLQEALQQRHSPVSADISTLHSIDKASRL